jgi:23S rRNA pseudouridine2604 synthase
VTINGKVAVSGDRLQFGDSVKLDGKIQHWEGAAKAKEQRPQSILENQKFSYVKFWKPRGVTCTSDRKDPDNIITRGGFKLFPQRMFTVGRLDKDSTGLILLTSDGRVNNALLNPHSKNEKEYEVTLSKVPSDEQIKDLRDGVVITTVMQRDTYSKPVTARTKPCIVERVGEPKHRKLRIVLTEGRNRQIRRMVETLGNGFHVVELHRTRFCGVSLKGVAHGHWKELEPKEMDVIVNKIASNNDRIERLKAEGKAEKDNTYVYMEDGEE